MEPSRARIVLEITHPSIQEVARIAMKIHQRSVKRPYTNQSEQASIPCVVNVDNTKPVFGHGAPRPRLVPPCHHSSPSHSADNAPPNAGRSCQSASEQSIRRLDAGGESCQHSDSVHSSRSRDPTARAVRGRAAGSLGAVYLIASDPREPCERLGTRAVGRRRHRMLTGNLAEGAAVAELGSGPRAPGA